MRSKARTTLIRNALLLGAASAAAIGGAQVGCSSAGTISPRGTPPESVLGPQSSPPADTVGSVGMELTLPGGEQINSVNWTITGPNGASTVVQTGTVNVGNSTTVSFMASGIPAGTNYLVSLTGTSADGTVTCAGSATFNVVARTTTNVSVALSCNTKPQDSGSALITATTFNCATWNSVSTSPSETTVGNSVTVSASASGPNPGGLTYAWSAPSGTFDNANAATAQFTCAAPGAVTLTLRVSDGPTPSSNSCDASLSTTQVTVQCDGHLDQAAQLPTATKIKHLVVIFGENISYDHYFGTYPVAQNAVGDTPFTAAPGTPTSNNLSTPLDPTHAFAPLSGVNLLTSNPNAANTANGAGATNPFRLGPTFAATADQGHNYAPEQKADDNGAMDLFPVSTGTAGPPPGSIDGGLAPGEPAISQTKGLVMAYYDGNTLGTLWGLAQSYAMNDNSWSTVFGPSTPGAINLIAGQTNGFLATNRSPTLMSPNHVTPDGNGGWTLIGDTDPVGDTCSTAADQNSFVGKNVGDLLNTQGVSWGWFEGGFDLTVTNANNTTGCARSTPQTVPYGSQTAGQTSADYIPHHAPFQYYPSTANLTHARPSSTAAIGKSVETDGVTAEPANHQYDTHDFFTALSGGNLPAVVYLKAPAYQDGHPGYSNPIDEGNFVANVVSQLQGAQEWSSTALVVAYDDSDGWYDHQMPPIVNPSNGVADFLNGSGLCTSGAQQNGPAPTTALLGAVPAEGGAAVPVLGRCGYGTRMPLMVISPFAKHNYIDHTLTDQSSVLKFVEDNWLGGQRIQPGGSFDTIAGTIQNMLTGI
jgi:phospholipase C